MFPDIITRWPGGGIYWVNGDELHVDVDEWLSVNGYKPTGRRARGAQAFLVKELQRLVPDRDVVIVDRQRPEQRRVFRRLNRGTGSMGQQPLERTAATADEG